MTPWRRFPLRRGSSSARSERPAWTTRVLPAGRLVVPLALGMGAVGARTANTWLLLVSCATAAPLLVSLALRPGGAFLSISCPARVVAGRTFGHVVRVRNPGPRSLPAIEALHRLDGFGDVRLALPSLAPGAVADFVVSRPALERGVWTSQHCEWRTCAPFGLVERTMRTHGAVRIVVHPRQVEPAEVATPGHGEQPADRPGHAAHELHALREWRRGDELRRVHWRATARHGQLVVVVPEDTREPRLSIVVQGSSADPDWERLVSVTAWTAVEAVRRGHLVRVAAPNVPELTGADGEAVLDWFAHLRDVPGPATHLLGPALRWTGEHGVVVVASTVAPSEAVGPGDPRALHLRPDGQVSGA